MKTVSKALATFLFVGLVTVQHASAQEDDGPCTDPDVPAETEDEETDDDKDKDEEVEKDDSGGYWWNDDGDIKRVWPTNDPDAPWNRSQQSSQSSADDDNPDDVSEKAHLTDLEIAYLFLLCRGHSEEEAVWIIEVMFQPGERAIAIPAF